jgi:hypothetical protein
VKALSSVFKAKILEALRARNVSIPNAGILMASPWCVYSKACLTKPEMVIQYLSRHTKKGMLSEARLQCVDDAKRHAFIQRFSSTKGIKTDDINWVEFVRRYLSHILPKGFMPVRHYGFLSNRCR